MTKRGHTTGYNVISPRPSMAVRRPTLGFVGAGAVGRALAQALSGRGFQVVAVTSRAETSARDLAEAAGGARPVSTTREVAELAELVFLTVPDDAIAAVCQSGRWRAGHSVVHCSGGAGLQVLDSAHRAGARVGSFHPLQTFPREGRRRPRLRGITFGIQADDELFAILHDMAHALGGHTVRLRPGDETLYHVSAVFVSNYLANLYAIGIDLWKQLGLPEAAAARALGPLLASAAENLTRLGLPEALTGPVARGDTGTVRRHLDALWEVEQDLAAIYMTLAARLLPIAEAGGLKPEAKLAVLQALAGWVTQRPEERRPRRSKAART